MGSCLSHSIAPTLVLRGEDIWPIALPAGARLGQRPLLLGRSGSTLPLRLELLSRLQGAGLDPRPAHLFHDCCEEDLARLRHEAEQHLP
ncbi:MAG: oxidoreductase, partial [Cyanobium sp.]